MGDLGKVWNIKNYRQNLEAENDLSSSIIVLGGWRERFVLLVVTPEVLFGVLGLQDVLE